MAEKPDELLHYQSATKLLEPGRLVIDPAMLKLLPIEKLRDIALISMRAQVAALEGYAKAQHAVIEELQKMKF